MPGEPGNVTRQIARFHNQCRGAAVPSKLARQQQRFGVPAPALRLNSVSNQLAFLLWLGSLRGPGPVTAGRPHTHGGEPIAAPRGLTGALAQAPGEQIPLRPVDSVDPAEGMPMLDAVTNVAAATCVRRPPECGRMVVGGLVLTATAGAVGRTLSWLFQPPQAPSPSLEPPPQPLPPHTYSYNPALLPSGIAPHTAPTDMTFNASQLDPGTLPCTSLYGHVNQRWHEGFSMSEGRTEQGAFTDLRDLSLLIRWQLADQMAALPAPTAGERVVADLWRTGMDTTQREQQGLKPLQPQLDTIKALATPAALREYLFAQSALGRNPLFEFTVMPDMKHSDQHLAYIAQDGLGLPDSAWYADPEKAHLLVQYQQHVETMLVLSGMSVEQARTTAAEVVALERTLAAASVPFAELSTDITHYYQPVTLDQARRVTPGMDWQALFQAHGHTVPDTFSLGMPDYFQALDTLLERTPLPVWQAYLRFHAMDAAAPHLGSEFADAHDAFHGGVMKGRQSHAPLGALVLDTIERTAGEAMSPAYIQVAYPPQSAQAMNALASSLRATLQRRLATVDWMDAPTRKYALEKAQRMELSLGHPDHWSAWEGVVTGNESFLANVQQVEAFVHQRNVAQLDKQVDAAAWRMTPQTADAYHDLLRNRIVMPAALMQPPFFDAAADLADNYGGIGVVIGHELAHAFDANGHLFNAEGNLQDWWPAEVRDRFETNVAHLVQQLNQHTVNGQRVNGNVTMNESLADVGGLAIAYDALQAATAGQPDPMTDDLTRDQRFFLNYARCWRRHATDDREQLGMQTDVHAPPRVRTDVAASNLAAFGAAFQCPADSPMQRPPEQRVRFL